MLDLWFEQEVKRRLRGRALEIRFADDAALVLEREEDARRVLAVLAKRFARDGLRLDPENTRLSMTIAFCALLEGDPPRVARTPPVLRWGLRGPVVDSLSRYGPTIPIESRLPL